MGSWSASGNRFPFNPRRLMLDYLSAADSSAGLSGHEDRRIRPERHNPHSIATLRIVTAQWLVGQLPQCLLLRMLRLIVGVDIPQRLYRKRRTGVILVPFTPSAPLQQFDLHSVLPASSTSPSLAAIRRIEKTSRLRRQVLITEHSQLASRDWSTSQV